MRAVSLVFLAFLALPILGLSGALLPEDPLRPFEVQQPLSVPGLQPCTLVLFQHVFSNSYGQPAVVNYTPPSGCGYPGSWSSVVVNVTGSSNGVGLQFTSSHMYT
jgi:hypothetical protein